MTQNDLILRELKQRDLTALDAVELGIMRLAARISDLRNEGYEIETETIKTAGGARVARYRLTCQRRLL
jgi:hypothetical protein